MSGGGSDQAERLNREMEARRKRLEAEETRKKQLSAQQRAKNLRYQGSAYSYFLNQASNKSDGFGLGGKTNKLGGDL